MLDATQRSSVIFSAYAKLPAGITAYEVHKVIGVVVEIDMHTGRILQAECTLATIPAVFCRRNVRLQPNLPAILSLKCL